MRGLTCQRKLACRSAQLTTSKPPRSTPKDRQGASSSSPSAATSAGANAAAGAGAAAVAAGEAAASAAAALRPRVRQRKGAAVHCCPPRPAVASPAAAAASAEKKGSAGYASAHRRSVRGSPPVSGEENVNAPGGLSTASPRPTG